MNNAKDQVIIYEQKFIGDIIEFIAMFAWALVMIGMHEYHQREKETDILYATAQFLFVAAVIMIPFCSLGRNNGNINPAMDVASCSWNIFNMPDLYSVAHSIQIFGYIPSCRAL